ncbi:MAG: hypothetical protein ABI895_25420 [Deltaproteobacteria bacterium]
MLSRLRAVGGAVLVLSLACAGGEALEPERSGGEPAAEASKGASAAQPAEGVPGAGETVVLGNEDTPEITEGSNTNWRPLDPEQGGKRPPFSKTSAPVVKPNGKGSAGSGPRAASDTAASDTAASDTAASDTAAGAPTESAEPSANAASSEASTPGPVAP